MELVWVVFCMIYFTTITLNLSNWEHIYIHVCAKNNFFSLHHEATFWDFSVDGLMNTDTNDALFPHL